MNNAGVIFNQRHVVKKDVDIESVEQNALKLCSPKIFPNIWQSSLWLEFLRHIVGCIICLFTKRDCTIDWKETLRKCGLFQEFQKKFMTFIFVSSREVFATGIKMDMKHATKEECIDMKNLRNNTSKYIPISSVITKIFLHSKNIQKIMMVVLFFSLFSSDAHASYGIGTSKSCFGWIYIQ